MDDLSLMTGNAHLLPIDRNDPSLVLYLPLWYPHGDMTGTTIYSYDKNRISCTTDAVWGYQGRTFNGSTSTLIATHNANQLLTAGGTIEAWIKPNSYGELDFGAISDKSVGTNGVDGYTFSLGTDRLYCNINNGGQVYGAAGSIVPDGITWYFAVVTWDATGLVTFYVNSVQSGTPANSGDPTGITTTNALTIGNRSGATDRAFDGLIGENMVYNRVLPQGEITNTYLATKWRYL